MSRLRGLEDFDAPLSGRRPRDGDAAEAVAQARGEGHAAGYAEGFAAAAAQAETEDRAALLSLRESLQDLELTATGARAQAADSVGPVLLAALRAAAPAAASAGFAEAVLEAVRARLAAQPEARLIARCAPERLEGLAGRLGDLVELRPDPELIGARVEVGWSEGGFSLDPQGCAEAACEAVARHFAPPIDEGELSDVG